MSDLYCLPLKVRPAPGFYCAILIWASCLLPLVPMALVLQMYLILPFVAFSVILGVFEMRCKNALGKVDGIYINARRECYILIPGDGQLEAKFLDGFHLGPLIMFTIVHQGIRSRLMILEGADQLDQFHRLKLFLSGRQRQHITPGTG